MCLEKLKPDAPAVEAHAVVQLVADDAHVRRAQSLGSPRTHGDQPEARSNVVLPEPVPRSHGDPPAFYPPVRFRRPFPPPARGSTVVDAKQLAALPSSPTLRGMNPTRKSPKSAMKTVFIGVLGCRYTPIRAETSPVEQVRLAVRLAGHAARESAIPPTVCSSVRRRSVKRRISPSRLREEP